MQYPTQENLDWTVLPAELQQLIFSDVNLQVQSLCVLRLVCKRWCVAIANLPCFFSGFNNRKLTSEKIQKIMFLFPNCYNVNLTLTTKLVSSDLLCMYRLRALRQLQLDTNISGDALQAVASLENITKSLRYLCFSGGASSEKPSLCCLTSFRNLKTLLLRVLDLSEALSSASTLRFLTSLELFNMSHNAGGLFAMYLSQLGNLRTLKVYDSHLQLTREDSDAICRLPSLANLVIEIDDEDEVDWSSPSTSRAAVAPPSTDAVRALTNLVELDVSGLFAPVKVISNFGTLNQLTKLRVASFREKYMLTTEELRNLAPKVPLLRLLMVPVPPTSDDVLEALSRFPSLLRLSAIGTKTHAVTDAGIAYLTRMQSLESLTLNSFDVTDIAAQHVGRLRGLTFLSALRVPWSATALRHLSALSSLRFLVLSHTPLNDFAFEPIARSNPHLYRLALSNCHLASATYLSCLRSLRHLDVCGNAKFDDAAVASLSSCLDTLNIVGTNVTGVGFANAPYRSLRYLTFVQPFVEYSLTEEGAACLARFTNVKNLNLGTLSLPDGIIRALLSGDCKYETLGLKELTAAQAPLLLRQTELRNLQLEDPIGMTEVMYETISTSLRALAYFQVRAKGIQVWKLNHTKASPSNYDMPPRLVLPLFIILLFVFVFAKPPNILVILADDLGIGEVEIYPSHSTVGRIMTPVLNKLANQSMVFTNAYRSPVCAPSRCTLMTGAHTGHAYIRGNRDDPNTGQWDIPLLSNTTTVAAMLQHAGYNTALIGKWGLGYNGTSGAPRQQGFNYYYGQLDQSQAHNLYPPFVWENEEQVMLPTNANASRSRCMSHKNTCQYADSLFNKKAIEWLKCLTQEDGEEQWKMVRLCLRMSEEKEEASEVNLMCLSDGPYVNQTWPTVEKDHASAITTVLDAGIGKILRVLEQIGQENDTVVFFMSDNGAHNEGGHNVYFFDSMGIYRGFKRSLYEGGVRTPAMVRWPGVVAPNSVSDFQWAFWDFMATAADIAGIDAAIVPENDGISIVPVLRGDAELPVHAPLYFEFCTNQTWGHSLRKGDWKIVSFSIDEPLQLYNVESDPNESNDLAALYPNVVTELQALALAAHHDSPLWPTNPCISSFLLHEDE